MKNHGFHVVYGQQGPCCIVRDAQTNTLHESLSDQEVVFMGKSGSEIKEMRAAEGADGNRGSTNFTMTAEDLPETLLAKMRAGPQLS